MLHLSIITLRERKSRMPAIKPGPQVKREDPRELEHLGGLVRSVVLKQIDVYSDEDARKLSQTGVQSFGVIHHRPHPDKKAINSQPEQLTVTVQCEDCQDRVGRMNLFLNTIRNVAEDLREDESRGNHLPGSAERLPGGASPSQTTD